MDRCSDIKQQKQNEAESLQIGRRYRNVNFATRASGVLTSRYPSVDSTLGEFVRFPMTSRTRFLITAAFVCHLLLAPSLVTSQLRSPTSASNGAQDLPNTPSAPREEDVTISAISQEKIGRIYKLHGKAEIHYGVYILHGDEVTYNADTGDSTADGHVVLEGGPNDEHIEASHGTYNVRAESGRFENVTGSIGVQTRGSRLMLTSSNPFFFHWKGG
jgi:LPS-assembly protein